MPAKSKSDKEINRKQLLESTSNQLSQAQSEEYDDRMSVKTERRGILKGLAVSIASAIGLAGTASATSRSIDPREKKQALQEYEKKSAIKEAFGSHEELFAELVSDDAIETKQIGTLEFDITYDKVDPEQDTPVVHLSTKRVGDEIVSKLELIQNTPDGLLQVAVFPDHNHSFAFFDPHDGIEAVSEYGDGPIEPTLSGNDISPSNKCSHVSNCGCAVKCQYGDPSNDNCPCICGGNTKCNGYCCCTCGIGQIGCCF